MFKVICTHCDSEYTFPITGTEGVYHCSDCGEYFEDPFFDPDPDWQEKKMKFRKEDE